MYMEVIFILPLSHVEWLIFMDNEQNVINVDYKNSDFQYFW